MLKLNYTVEMRQAPKSDNHKLNVFVLQNYINDFGKTYTIRKLFDTILPSEKDLIIKQIQNIYK